MFNPSGSQTLPHDIDETDIHILDLLQQDSRMSQVKISEQVGLSPPSVNNRIKRLRHLGYIQGYTALLNKTKLGFGMQCFMHVSLQTHDMQKIQHFQQLVQAMPEVQACYQTTGEYDYILQIIVRDQQGLQVFLNKKLTPIEGIARVQTSLVLSEIKSTQQLPLRPAK